MWNYLNAFDKNLNISVGPECYFFCFVLKIDIIWSNEVIRCFIDFIDCFFFRLTLPFIQAFRIIITNTLCYIFQLFRHAFVILCMSVIFWAYRSLVISFWGDKHCYRQNSCNSYSYSRWLTACYFCLWKSKRWCRVFWFPIFSFFQCVG